MSTTTAESKPPPTVIISYTIHSGPPVESLRIVLSQAPARSEQEAQLPQRDRATFHVIDYLLSHSRSLKVIQNDTVV